MNYFQLIHKFSKTMHWRVILHMAMKFVRSTQTVICFVTSKSQFNERSIIASELVSRTFCWWRACCNHFTPHVNGVLRGEKHIVDCYCDILLIEQISKFMFKW